MRNLNLNKREKILIYVLSIVLLLFIYMNFIRDAKVTKINSLKLNESTAQECENLIKLNSTFESDIKNLSKVNDRISTQHLNFGNRVDLAEKIVEHNLELISYSISKPQRESYKGMDYSYIESVSILEGTLGYFINLLKYIENIEYLYMNEYSINRINHEKFQFTIILREFTLKDLPITGIAYREINGDSELSNPDSSLINALYNNDSNIIDEDKEEETNTSSNTKNNSSVNKSASKSNTSKSSSSPSTKEQSSNKSEPNLESLSSKPTKEEVIELIYPEKNVEIDNKTSEEIILNNPEDIFKLIENNSRNVNDFNKLDKDRYYPLLNGEYAKNNYGFLKEISNIESLKNDEQLTLNIENTLPMSENPLVIKRKFTHLYFELDGKVGTELTMYFLDDNYKLIPVEFIKVKNGIESFILELPTDFSYPVDIESLITYNKGENHGKIKNIVAFD